jgi:phospholipase/lecithinase/hemolysin
MFTTRSHTPARASRRTGLSRVAPRLEVLEDRNLLSASLIGNLVNFGDSLSDAGNFSLATGGALPPSPPYVGGHFSNGPIWADTLAEYLGAAPVQPSLAGGLDYAFGGAQATGHAAFAPYNAIPNVQEQVAMYLAAHQADLKPSDLFTVWAGANDFFFSADVGAVVNPAVPAQAVADAVKTLITAKADGARQFLVADMPMLGQTPFFQDLPAGPVKDAEVAGANAWSAGFNFSLSQDLQQLRATYGVTILEVNVAQDMQQAIDQHQINGITNWTDPVGPTNALGLVTSVSPGVNPDHYLFWDSVHPTTKGHQILGRDFAAVVYAALGQNTLTVDTTADDVDPTDGKLSLREMLNLANTMGGQQSIVFDLGQGSQEIKLNGSELAVRDDVTVRGPSQGPLAIDGQGASRLFSVDAGVSATFSNLVFRDGAADQGGAIQNAGRLTIWDSQFVSNMATGVNGVGMGGAIYNGPGATLDVHDSVFLSNQASSSGGLSAGGAIANDGAGANATVDGSLFLFNQAVGGRQSLGGGLANLNGAALTVSNSVIAWNSAVGGDRLADGAGGDALGGGIYNGPASSLDLRQSILLGNTAQGGTGTSWSRNGKGLGGGVYLAAGGSALKQATWIVGNFASTSGNDVFGDFSSVC